MFVYEFQLYINKLIENMLEWHVLVMSNCRLKNTINIQTNMSFNKTLEIDFEIICDRPFGQAAIIYEINP